MEARIILLFVITIAGLLPLHLQSTLVKQYNVKTLTKTFLKAQESCREKYTNLVTIENLAENDYIMYLGSYYGLGYVWIGLYDNRSSWTWSMNETAFDNGIDFNNWDQLEPQLTIVSKICVYMTPEGRWCDELCTEKLPALCYYEPGPAIYILVTMPMTWDQAQLYCRSNYTDLVSVRNMTENNNVSVLVTSNTWIGLYRQGWGQWSDQSPLIFNNFKSQDHQTSNEPLNCARLNTATGAWTIYSCSYQCYIVCEEYVEMVTAQDPDVPPPGSKSTFQLRQQSDTDLNDPSVQEQILQQLHSNLGKHGLPDLKLSWVQTNGQVFHKEPAEKEKQGC